MTSIRQLLTSANPVPDRPPGELSPRAQDELRTLVGPVYPAPVARPARARRWVPVALVVASVIGLAGVIGIVALSRADPPPPMVDEPFYGTTEELEDRADSILRGTLLSTREQEVNGFPETVATASVDRVATGPLRAGEQVEFSYPTPGSGPETPTGLAVDGEYVLLLVHHDDGTASLVNTTQGYYPIVAGQATAGPDNPVALSAETRQALDLR